MKEIRLSRGLAAIVDDCDFEELNRLKWYALKHRTGRFYAVTRVKKRYRLMHRIILGIDRFENKIDHINQNSLDNRRCNLRICTNSENMMNRGATSTNKSGYKGVIKSKERRKNIWKAQISSNGKTAFIGYFSSPTEAAAAYNEKAKELHGEFASLNKL